MFAKLEQVGAEWLVLTRRRMVQRDYFDTSPSFEIAYADGDLVRIYRIRRPLVATPTEIVVSSALGAYLDRVEVLSPEVFEVLARDYFGAKLGVGRAQLEGWRDVLRGEGEGALRGDGALGSAARVVQRAASARGPRAAY